MSALLTLPAWLQPLKKGAPPPAGRLHISVQWQGDDPTEPSHSRAVHVCRVACNVRRWLGFGLGLGLGLGFRVRVRVRVQVRVRVS